MLQIKGREIEREERHRQEVAALEADHAAARAADRELKNRAAIELLKQKTTIAEQERDLARFQAGEPPTQPPITKNAPEAPKTPAVQLSAVIDSFMAKQDAKAPMFKKYQTVLPMFLAVTGDRSIGTLKQQHIEDFFSLLHRLPPRWAPKCRQMKKTVQELAAMEWEKCIAKATFEGTYIAAMNVFLKEKRRTKGDQGFPRHLTTEGIKYRGDRKEGEEKQRAFRQDELKRLFEGTEAQAIAADPKQAHCYWLPLLGLYTGARVNEVCQLNPQCDIQQEPETGIWFFDITEESETAKNVTKSVKNDTSKRKIPIHSALLGLGFLDYLERVKATGAKILFPKFPPMRGKACGKAEKEFRKHLRKLNLRDETPGARLVGFHAFRHTFTTQAELIDEPRADVITGHAREGESKAKRGYRQTSLTVKRQILERFTFDVQPPKPARPVTAPAKQTTA
jgi:integrase